MKNTTYIRKNISAITFTITAVLMLTQLPLINQTRAVCNPPSGVTYGISLSLLDGSNPAVKGSELTFEAVPDNTLYAGTFTWTVPVTSASVYDDTNVIESTKTVTADNVGEKHTVKVKFDPDDPEVKGTADATMDMKVVDFQLNMTDSNGRESASAMLEVKPESLQGETITCELVSDASWSFPSNYPKWTITKEGATVKEISGTETVTFEANGFNTGSVLLSDSNDSSKMYKVQCKPLPDCFTYQALVIEYTSKVGTCELQAADFDKFVEFVTTLKDATDFAEPFGSVDLDPEPDITGSFSFTNQFKEKDNHEVVHCWSLSSDSSAEAGIKASFTASTFMNVPPFLLEVNAFIQGSGSLGVGADVQKDIDSWKVKGGAEGSLNIGLGGGVEALSEVLRCEMSANTKLTGKGELIGTKSPAGLDSEVKLVWDPLIVEFEVTAFYDFWHTKSEWEAFDENVLYDQTVDIVPGLISGSG